MKSVQMWTCSEGLVGCVAVSLAYRSKVATAHGGHKAAMCLLCIHTCVHLVKWDSSVTFLLTPPLPPLPQPNSNLHMFSIFQLQQGGSSGAPLIKVVQGEPVMVALHCGCVLQSGPPQLNGGTVISDVLNHVLTGSFKGGRLLNSRWLSILLCGRHMEWKAVNVSLAVGLAR